MRKSIVVKYFGSQTKIAKALGIKPAAVYQWSEIIPPLRSFQLERITNGVLKTEDSDKQAG